MYFHIVCIKTISCKIKLSNILIAAQFGDSLGIVHTYVLLTNNFITRKYN